MGAAKSAKRRLREASSALEVIARLSRGFVHVGGCAVLLVPSTQTNSFLKKLELWTNHGSQFGTEFRKLKCPECVRHFCGLKRARYYALKILAKINSLKKIFS